jgi:hypothetical protein
MILFCFSVRKRCLEQSAKHFKMLSFKPVDGMTLVDTISKVSYGSEG